MSASFKVLYDSHREKDVLVVDFGGSAIGRVAPINSLFWWLILLSSYTKCTRDVDSTFHSLSIAIVSRSLFPKPAVQLIKSVITSGVSTNKELFNGLANARHRYRENLGFMPNAGTGSPIIHGYGTRGNKEVSHKVFDKMKLAGINTDSYTYASLISGLFKKRIIETASASVKKTVTVDGVDFDLGFLVYNEVTYPNMMEFFESLGVDMEVSDMSFSVSLDKGNNYEWRSRNGFSSLFAQMKNALNLYFWQMIREIIKFNDHVLRYLEELAANPAIDRNTTLGHFINVGEVFAVLILVYGSNLRTIYGKIGNMVWARNFFDEMPERSQVSWTALIVGHTRHKDRDNASHLFNQMSRRNSVAWNAMIEDNQKHFGTLSSHLTTTLNRHLDCITNLPKSWVSFLCLAYPDLHLEDKVVFQALGNDTILPSLPSSHACS